MSDDDKYSVEESRALRVAIFPNYPDLRGMQPIPDVGEFLRNLRATYSRDSTDGDRQSS